MSSPVFVRAVRHREGRAAAEIHAIQLRAYAQEAKLIGAIYFPPVERTIADIQASSESYLGAFKAARLVGALSYGPDEEGAGINIGSLVVDPGFQRLGIGQRLVHDFLAIHASDDTTVQTGVKNVAALALYAKCGFIEYRRWLVGPEPLELVKLRRRSRPAQNGE